MRVEIVSCSLVQVRDLPTAGENPVIIHQGTIMTSEEFEYMRADAYFEAAIEHRPVCIFNHPYFPDQRFILFEDMPGALNADGVKPKAP